MTEPNVSSARYRFSPQDRTGWLLGLSGAQCLILAAGLAAAGLVLPVSPPAALAVVGAAVVVAFAGWEQEPAYRQLGLRVAWHTRRRAGRTTWISPQPFQATRTARTPQLPVTFGRLRFWTTTSSAWSGAEVVVIEDTNEATFTVVVPAAARAFTLLEHSEQERLLAGWGDLLAGFTSSRHPLVRLTVSEWAGPNTHSTTRSEPAGPAADPTAVAAYTDLVDMAGPRSQRHETLVALTVRPTPLGRRQRRRTRAGEAGVAVAVEQARLLAGRLDTIGIDTRPPLGTAALAGLLRCRLDPSARTSTGGRWGRSGPMAARAEWDHAQLDGGVHAVFWVAEWPRLPVTAAWLEPLLLHAGRTRTLTLLVEPVSARDAARRIRRDATRLAADQHQRERSGWRVDAEHHRTSAEVEQRENELAAGYAELDYLGLLTVTAPTPQVLAEACREFEDVASQLGVELRRLDGRHDLALPAALGFLGRPVPGPRWR